MASKVKNEDKDALDALEAEAKEFDKVCLRPTQLCMINTNKILPQDAEIDRILKAFRLDA